MTPATSTQTQNLTISYLGIRKAIGVLGIALPFLLAGGTLLSGSCNELLDSVSAYYHTNMRNIFVGVLSAIALFFYCYRGYDTYDFISWKLAGTFALGIALFPAEAISSLDQLNDNQIRGAFNSCELPSVLDRPWVDTLHLIFAALFFLTLIYISWFLFTKSSQEIIVGQKAKRNRVFRVTAIVMLVCILLIAVYMLWLRGKYGFLDHLDPIYWLETIGLVAFGIAWITKGQMVFGD